MIEIRKLKENELPEIWTIDRREMIENIYYYREGKLVLEAEHYDLQGWPPEAPGFHTPVLHDCYKRGGFFLGAFEDEALVGVAVLESKFIGSKKDALQLKFLHVSHDIRKQGLGKKLFIVAAEKARSLGAKKMYISAIPAENAIRFYQYLGCTLAEEVDAELFEMEPEDIHLEYLLN